MTRWRTGLRVVSGALLGAVVAVLVLLTHRDEVELFGLRVPAGLVLAVVASVLTSLALRSLAGSAAVAGYGVGWCLVVLVAINGRSEGDYLVAGDWLGWTFLALCTLGVVVVTVRGTLPDKPRRRVREDPDDLLTRRP